MDTRSVPGVASESMSSPEVLLGLETVVSTLSAPELAMDSLSVSGVASESLSAPELAMDA
jgi:hypothetical protein